jgi:hypothetical protein
MMFLILAGCNTQTNKREYKKPISLNNLDSLPTEAEWKTAALPTEAEWKAAALPTEDEWKKAATFDEKLHAKKKNTNK